MSNEEENKAVQKDLIVKNELLTRAWKKRSKLVEITKKTVNANNSIVHDEVSPTYFSITIKRAGFNKSQIFVHPDKDALSVYDTTGLQQAVKLVRAYKTDPEFTDTSFTVQKCYED